MDIYRSVYAQPGIQRWACRSKYRRNNGASIFPLTRKSCAVNGDYTLDGAQKIREFSFLHMKGVKSISPTIFVRVRRLRALRLGEGKV